MTVHPTTVQWRLSVTTAHMSSGDISDDPSLTGSLTSANSNHPVPTIEALTILLNICAAHAHVSGGPRLMVHIH